MPDAVEIILASRSPRRFDLLTAAGYVFQVIAPDIDEIPKQGELPAEFAKRAALEKAVAVAKRLLPCAGGRKIIGCDTVVTIDGAILGKPVDPQDAAHMLRRLCGRTHQVLSGLCVLKESETGARTWRVRVVSTEVDFREVSEGDLTRYVETGEPMDKAGAYAIQGGAAHMVSAIRGSYTNVVGLPLSELIHLLNQSD